MTYTIDDIKRLVPEAEDVEQFNTGKVTFRIGDCRMWSHHDDAQALLTTRAEVERVIRHDERNRQRFLFAQADNQRSSTNDPSRARKGGIG